MSKLRLAKEAFKKVGKYKWHDLRKNPDDLPDVGKPFVFAFLISRFKKEARYGAALGNKYDIDILRLRFDASGEIEYIAWAYIEPFDQFMHEEEEKVCE